MFFQHIYDKSLAQGSYLIGCQAKGEAIVIDAQRDIDVYLEIAQQNNLKITHITETHIHADYLCGSRELAEVTGAKMYLSEEGGPDWQYEFDHIGVKDGDKIHVGNLSFEVMHTPGHTPESISFILRDHPATDEPVMAFTGDFVFVGDIGRPDLLEEAAGWVGTKEVGAKQMYQSIQRFAQLPDHLQIWPAHGAGSACGKALGAVANSTVGYEKIRNWAFQFEDAESEFVQQLLADQPEPPKYFAMMKKLNKIERPLLTSVPRHKKLSKEEFKTAFENGIKVIDTRNKMDYAAGYIPGTLSIQGTNSLSTWAGWLLNYEESFVLIADNDAKMEDLTRKLMRIGLDNIVGYVTDIENLGFKLEQEEIVDFQEMKELVQGKKAQLLDVRGLTEFKSGHIEGAKHLFVGTLTDHLHQLDPQQETIVFCQSGDRTSVAYSILKRAGFTNVKSYMNGMKEWNDNNEKVVIGVKEVQFS